MQFRTVRAGLLNFSSGNEAKRNFWAKSWSGAALELKFAILVGPGPVLNFSLGMNRNRPFRPNPGRGALLELKFAILDGPDPAIEFFFWE